MLWQYIIHSRSYTAAVAYKLDRFLTQLVLGVHMSENIFEKTFGGSFCKHYSFRPKVDVVPRLRNLIFHATGTCPSNLVHMSTILLMDCQTPCYLVNDFRRYVYEINIGVLFYESQV